MDPIVAATLAWCNDRRAENQLEPLPDLPKGKREDPTSCPCGAATGLYVENTGYYATSKKAYYDFLAPEVEQLPAVVNTFVRAFDRGDYPEYDIGEDEPGGET